MCRHTRNPQLLLPAGGCDLLIPRTGTTWRRRAYWAAGVPFAFRTAGVPHGGPVYTFVRRPCEYLASCWKSGASLTRGLARLSRQAASFGDYVDLYLRRMPGAISRHFADITGRCGFVGRLEFATEDIAAALRYAGEKFDEDRLQAVPPANVTVRERPLVWREGQRERLEDAELWILETFYP